MYTPPRTEVTADVCPEVQVLLCCAQCYHDPASASQLLPLLRHDLDWAALIGLALRHRVLPLLYRGLQTISPGMIPHAIQTELQHYFHANARRNLLQAGTLLKLLRVLEMHHIPAIPYKGPGLAMLAYGNLTLRQFGDLDLLVRPQDARRAQALLWDQGYRWQHDRSPARFPHLLKVYELISADGQVLVELHWALTSATFYFPLHLTCLWDRLETAILLDTPVRTLSPADLLLTLCVHGAKHQWHRLAWICDVAALLRASPQLDWERCIAQARQLGGVRMLALGLCLAHDLLGAVLPTEVWRWMHTEPIVPWLAAHVRSQLFTVTANLAQAWDHPAFYLALRERIRDRLPCYLYLAYRTWLPAVLKHRVGRWR